jgi:ferritin-like metal-binding protein YciE
MSAAGLDVTTSARTLVDMGRSVGFESAVVSMDAALRDEKTTASELRELLVLQSDWPGARAEK